MSAAAPPLRFILIVLLGWGSLRGLAMIYWRDVEGPAIAPAPGSFASRALAHEPATAPLSPAVVRPTGALEPPPVLVRSREAARPGPIRPLPLPVPLSPPAAGVPSPRPSAPLPFPSPFAAAAPDRKLNRWSGSAWLLVRQDVATPAFASGSSTLGGSQAGARLLYRLNGDTARPLTLAARIYAPLRDRRAAEAAIGVDWQPLAELPLHLLAERRERLGTRGRSAFSLTAYAGGRARLTRRIVADGYVQAGAVGLRSRDLFVDGAVRVAVPAGPVELGAGGWGAAQPGAARFEAGPQVSLRLPIGRQAVRLSADWRFRVAGQARPSSGPALTLGTDF